MTRRSYKIIKTTPMAPAGCHTHRHASRDSYYKNMINLIHHNSSFITTSGHIMSLLYIIACDVYYVYASCLLRSTVVNKMIPYNNFKKVFPLTVHRCEGSLFRSTT